MAIQEKIVGFTSGNSKGASLSNIKALQALGWPVGIQHESFCGSYRGGPCDCDPVAVLHLNATPMTEAQNDFRYQE